LLSLDKPKLFLSDFAAEAGKGSRGTVLLLPFEREAKEPSPAPYIRCVSAFETIWKHGKVILDSSRSGRCA
jgi:hypothetical protein